MGANFNICTTCTHSSVTSSPQAPEKHLANISHCANFFLVISVINKDLSKITYKHSVLKLFLIFFTVISDNALIFKKILSASFSVVYACSQKVLGIMGGKYIILIHGYRRHN